MELTEAIFHAREVAAHCDGLCKIDHTQLADWLEELARYKATGLEPEEVIRYKAFADKAVTEGVTMGEIKRFIGGENQKLPLTTGFSIKHLIDLGRAEKDGRLVVLPCKPGDTVYRIAHDEEGNPYIVKDLCVGIRIGLSGDLLMVTLGDRRWNMEKFGKSIFLTRDAAEAALKER